MTIALQKLGIIAGGGELPLRIAEACRRRGQPFFLLAIDELAEPVAPHLDSERNPISRLGRGLAILRRHECRDVVFAGKFERPGQRIRFRPDLAAIWFIVRNMGPLRRSDDTLHRILAREFERQGFRVVSPLDADPSLGAPRGVITRTQPQLNGSDLEYALKAAKLHGATDVGQAVVVRGGQLIAKEGKAGTDAMLAEVASRGQRGGVLAKAMKPQQIRDIDPPAVGARTITNAAAAGLDGLVVEAGATVVVDIEDVVATADRLGLFIVGLEMSGT